ncbi:hypothetical protein BLA60_22085 [Actinophytocola xinjiangensis]|uniref:Uncharacterized protein n=1 Tax=Actinophytocola xinjiangensis TaxID=485602 RepID=A0A7Z0WKZ8_9PSEU|nr:hypothetical protein BLA60_22085 [Actinophytocola xinjiangensis]
MAARLQEPLDIAEDARLVAGPPVAGAEGAWTVPLTARTAAGDWFCSSMCRIVPFPAESHW